MYTLIAISSCFQTRNEEIDLRDTSYTKQVIMVEPLETIGYKVAPLPLSSSTWKEVR